MTSEIRPATDAEITEIRERWEKATPGPWVRDYGNTVGHIKSIAAADTGSTPTVCRYDIWHPLCVDDPDGLYPLSQQEADGDFIAHAPTDIAKLLARVEAAEAERFTVQGLAETIGDYLVTVNEEWHKDSESYLIPPTMISWLCGGAAKAIVDAARKDVP